MDPIKIQSSQTSSKKILARNGPKVKSWGKQDKQYFNYFTVLLYYYTTHLAETWRRPDRDKLTTRIIHCATMKLSLNIF